MTSGEQNGGGKHQPRLSDVGFEQLTTNVARIIKVGGHALSPFTRDAQIATVITDEYADHRVSYDEHTQTQAGTMARIPLACTVVRSDRIPEEEEYAIRSTVVNLRPHSSDRASKRESTQTASSLLDEMIRLSNRTAFNIFYREMGGEEALREQYDTHGWTTTTSPKYSLTGILDEGKTTAGELHDQIQSLITGADGTAHFRDVARSALSASISPFGIHQRLSTSHDTTVMAATGTHQHHGAAYRHETEFVQGDKAHLWYTILGKAPLARARLLEASLTAISVEVALATGAPIQRSPAHQLLMSVRRRTKD